MKILELTTEFLIIFAITFVVSSLVSFFYSLLIHSKGIFDWGISLQLSITFGIIFCWMHHREKKN